MEAIINLNGEHIGRLDNCLDRLNGIKNDSSKIYAEMNEKTIRQIIDQILELVYSNRSIREPETNALRDRIEHCLKDLVDDKYNTLYLFNQKVDSIFRHTIDSSKGEIHFSEMHYQLSSLAESLNITDEYREMENDQWRKAIRELIEKLQTYFEVINGYNPDYRKFAQRGIEYQIEEIVSRKLNKLKGEYEEFYAGHEIPQTKSAIAELVQYFEEVYQQQNNPQQSDSYSELASKLR